MIIFGTRGMTTKARPIEILESKCPECASDLTLSRLKRWFTLYFIPIFPYSTIETFYKCASCDSTYKEGLKEILINRDQEAKNLEEKIEGLFLQTTMACLYTMAKIDGTISKEEKELLAKFGCDEEMIKEFNLLDNSKKRTLEIVRKASDFLTSEDILKILSVSTKMLLADGKIEVEEERLLKEYLLVAGLTEDLYETLLDNAKDQPEKKKIGEKFCGDCGSKGKDGDKFCSDCGSSI